MRVLVVKLSSMGDIIHTLPALTDAANVFDDISFDWVVEQSFAEIPRWHKNVGKIIPISLRTWRKNPFQAIKSKSISKFSDDLRENHYDAILDAQGLLKSAIVSSIARGKRYGLDKSSAREKLASISYNQTVNVPKGQHAVNRTRQLFAKALGYDVPITEPEYGIDKSSLPLYPCGDKDLLFLHGTTWATKHWPENFWYQLIEIASHNGFRVLLPWGNQDEKIRAESWVIKAQKQMLAIQPEILDRLSLTQLCGVLAGVKGVVSVDTGLGHLAAALAVPNISIYGPTDPILTGAFGPGQVHLKADKDCAPCFKRKCRYDDNTPPCYNSLSPTRIWAALQNEKSFNLV